MHKKKRAQITIYIIIGMVILFLAALLFYLGDTTEKKIDVRELIKSQEIPNEIKPITTYVTTSLDTAAREGLYLIGRQGGYIYQSQGGPIPNPTEEGIDFISYYEHKVSYGIYRQTEDRSYFYFFDPWKYPWENFPCIEPYVACEGDRIQLDLGSFGDYNLPPLNGSDPSNHSIESQLINYTTNYLQENIDLKLFSEQGFDITEGKMNVSVVIGEDDVIIFLEYPLIITKESTGMKANVTYFLTNPQIRLKKVYMFVEDILNKDIVRILFNISDPNNNGDDMTIEKVESAYERDDIIITRDDKSMLYAKPYTFQFARENRNPALHFIYDKEPLVKDCTFGIITEEDINPKAYDPDEDKLYITYDPGLPYLVADLPLNKHFYVRVTVDDEILTDWQDLEILVTCDANP